MRQARRLAGGRGAKALQLTLRLIGVEGAGWFLLGLLRASFGEGPIAAGVLLYLSERFGEITIGAATTAYVVFTYYLLESTEATRRRQTEPYLTVRWFLSREAASDRLPACGKLATDVGRWLRETLDLEPRQDESAAGRYVNVELSNARDEPLHWVQLGVVAAAAIPNQNPFEMRDQMRLDALNLQKGGRKEITLLDIGAIPTTATISVVVETIVYGPMEPNVVLDSFTGERQYGTRGTFPVGAPKAEVAPRAEP